MSTTAAARTRRNVASDKPTAKRTASRKTKPEASPKSVAEVLAENAARALAAAQIDAAASGRDLAEVLADMGLNPDGTIKPQAAKYEGPMLVLREAAKHYVIAPNGQPNCGDDLATVCGKHDPLTVIRALIDALQLESNPYYHLNIGQQSMNLRNKARNALKKDEIGMGQIRAAFVRAEAAIAAKAAA